MRLCLFETDGAKDIGYANNDFLSSSGTAPTVAESVDQNMPALMSRSTVRCGLESLYARKCEDFSQNTFMIILFLVFPFT